MSKIGRNPPVTDIDNPTWTAEDFARARPGREVLSPEILSAFGKPRGRPKAAEPKEPVTLRFSRGVAEHLRASGPGWQTRVNTAIAGLIKEGKL